MMSVTDIMNIQYKVDTDFLACPIMYSLLKTHDILLSHILFLLQLHILLQLEPFLTQTLLSLPPTQQIGHL